MIRASQVKWSAEPKPGRASAEAAQACGGLFLSCGVPTRSQAER